MSDTISRQAAISAICSACGKIDCDKMDKCEKLQLPPANCSEFPNSSDTISRQTAQRLFGKALTYKEQIGKLTWTTSEVKQWLADCIEQLPPAHGTNLAEVGTDCISRQAAIDVAKGPVVMLGLRSGKSATAAAVDAVKCIIVDGLRDLPPAQPEQPEIIYCKDCAKHNKGVGDLEVLPDGRNSWIWKDRACPLVSWRGKAQGHEFDYQYCVYAERRTDERSDCCDCYSDGRCLGTKEIDSCSCGGNKSKCDFYENVRREGDAE